MERLTKEAVLRAVERMRESSAMCTAFGQDDSGGSKDLTQVKYIVRTGGALARLPNRIEIMRSITETTRAA